MNRSKAAGLLMIAFWASVQAWGQTPQPQIPAEPGLYASTANGLIRIEGQAISFHRTGSLLVSGVTAGMKTAKINVQLPGRHSRNFVGSNPIFFYRMPPQLIQEGGGAGDLILLRMERKGDRRQVETGAAGIWRRSSGVSIKKQIRTEAHQMSPGLFRIQPVGKLDADEYGFYQFRGDMLPPYFYDFSTYWQGGS